MSLCPMLTWAWLCRTACLLRRRPLLPARRAYQRQGGHAGLCGAHWLGGGSRGAVFLATYWLGWFPASCSGCSCSALDGAAAWLAGRLALQAALVLGHSRVMTKDHFQFAIAASHSCNFMVGLKSHKQRPTMCLLSPSTESRCSCRQAVGCLVTALKWLRLLAVRAGHTAVHVHLPKHDHQI